MNESNEKQRIGLALSFGTVVGALYLFGYWGSFNINILEFIGIGDLLKLSIYPILISGASLLVSASASEFLRGNSLAPGGGANTPIGQFGRKHWRPLIVAYLLLIVALIYLAQTPNKWLVFAFLASFLSVPLSHLDFLIVHFPNPRSRGTILYFMLLIPGLSFFYGVHDAWLAKDGRGPQIVDVARSDVPLIATPEKQVAYLGFVGGYFVLLETSTGALAFLKPKDTRPIFLLVNPKAV
jgi:hypothetical protein